MKLRTTHLGLTLLWATCLSAMQPSEPGPHVNTSAQVGQLTKKMAALMHEQQNQIVEEYNKGQAEKSCTETRPPAAPKVPRRSSSKLLKNGMK